MTLRVYSAKTSLEIYTALKLKQIPPIGTFDDHNFRELLVKNSVQMGKTQYHNHSLSFEFICSSPGETSFLFTVDVETPEPLRFLPVPGWVIEDIYAGGIEGSFCFESEARLLIEKYKNEVMSEENEQYFHRKPLHKRDAT